MTSSYSDGKFFAPKAGFYLVLSNIATHETSGYHIKKNGVQMAVAYAHFASSDSDGYATSLSASMKLYVSEVITIEGTDVYHSSCITIVQL